MLVPFKDSFPKIDKTVFIAEGAFVIGNVTIEKECSIWYNVVIRGDVNYITIQRRTNVQDGCVLHVTNNKYPLIIGSHVTIGHNATVHACTIKDHVLIGMGSVILDNATVNTQSIIAAGSLLKMHFEVPQGVLAAGVPAKIIRDLTETEIKDIKQSADNYYRYAKVYKTSAGDSNSFKK